MHVFFFFYLILEYYSQLGLLLNFLIADNSHEFVVHLPIGVNPFELPHFLVRKMPKWFSW